MTSLIVAAIPCDTDPVWKVSSEKVPHLTMLYLGEYEDSTERQRMIEFIEHACASSLTEFYLSTDYRGTLGDDKADVLFFSKSSAKMVADFRSNLLANQELAKAYLSVQQYPTWTPHLTLGYPNKPAKPDPRENPEFYHWVKFDRIAFWDENYDGPTFQLKRDKWEEVSMSDDMLLFNGHTAVDKVLGTVIIEHHGVKGMKWGVRKEESGGGSKPKTTVKPRLSEDARKAVAVSNKIEKHGGTHALSNKEMEHLLNRMNLEQRYHKMTTPDSVDVIKVGQDKANQILNTIATGQKLNKVVLTPTAKAVAKWLATKGAKKAAAGVALALL